MRIKIDKADLLFSKYIREKADWTCERCGKLYPPPTTALQASHYFGRANEATRFDEDNVAAHCMGCHMRFTANPHEHTEWVKQKLGPERYKVLVKRSNEYKRKDRKAEFLRVKELYDALLRRKGKMA